MVHQPSNRLVKQPTQPLELIHLLCQQELLLLVQFALVVDVHQEQVQVACLGLGLGRYHTQMVFQRHLGNL
jgi:hypothetical protein